jgi:ABC-2 type transport system ATP-binding protein
MPEIVRDLDAAGVLLDDLSIRHPSLDDVFLTLTGHASETSAGIESEQS